LGLTVEISSLGDSWIVAWFPLGLAHSFEASRSAVSFPSIPVWLGILAKVVRVPLDFSLAISSRWVATVSLSVCVLDAMVFIAVLESLKTVTPGGWTSIW
jgi:hypothetical protein